VRALLWIGLYFASASVATLLGAWLLVAPSRAGAFLHTAYQIIPYPDSTTKRIVLRVAGLMLMAFGVLYGFGVVWRTVRAVFG
jgi:hypothetical protein